MSFEFIEFGTQGAGSSDNGRALINASSDNGRALINGCDNGRSLINASSDNGRTTA